MSTVMISKKLDKILRDRFSEGCHESIEIVESYSGRFMYGECCFGLRSGFGETSVLSAMADVLEEIKYSCDEDELPVVLEQYIRLLRAARTDSLGLGKIIYFPGFTLRYKDQDKKD